MSTDARAPLPPITEFLPHRGTMLLLDRVLHIDAQGCRTEFTPQANAWYSAANGAMPAWFGIELMAQTVAVHAGALHRTQGGAPKQGALLGTRRYETHAPDFPAGKVLQIQATPEHRDETGLSTYDCSIHSGGHLLASAVLKVFEPADAAAYFQGQTS